MCIHSGALSEIMNFYRNRVNVTPDYLIHMPDVMSNRVIWFNSDKQNFREVSECEYLEEWRDRVTVDSRVMDVDLERCRVNLRELQ